MAMIVVGWPQANRLNWINFPCAQIVSQAETVADWWGAYLNLFQALVALGFSPQEATRLGLGEI